MTRQIIVNNERHRLWCAMRLGFGARAFPDYCGSVGLEDERGGVLAVVVYSRFQSYDNDCAICEASIAALPSENWATKRFIRAILAYPFEVLGVSVINVICAANNKRARKFNRKLGFRRAGMHRRGYDGKRNAISYDMLPEDAEKWLGYVPEPLNAKEERKAANG